MFLRDPRTLTLLKIYWVPFLKNFGPKYLLENAVKETLEKGTPKILTAVILMFDTNGRQLGQYGYNFYLPLSFSGVKVWRRLFI